MVQSRPILIRTCPTDTVLQWYNDGRIENNFEIDRISAHLGQCEDCIDKLEKMVPGAIAEGLRESASNDEVLDDTKSGGLEQDLASLSGNLDQILSKADNVEPLHQVKPSALGENRYEVIATAGEGQFSSVFGALADDDAEPAPGSEPTSPKLLGIKIPHAHKLTTYRHGQQFFDDCQKARLLKHPGIQPVLEYGVWDDRRLYLTKPFIQYPTLTRFAKSSPVLSREMMLSIFHQIVDAVDYAHQQNVIHRHLTPNNIHLVPVEQPKSGPTTDAGIGIRTVVSDFGFVLDSRYHFDLIEPPDKKNPFFSPESAALNSDYVDVRADLYSLGKILKLLYRLTSNYAAQVEVKKIIDKSTMIRRRDRYQSVSELKAALKRI